MKSYSFTFTPNEYYSQEITSAYKGFFTVDYVSDLSNSFFVDLSTDILAPRGQGMLSSGPLSFNSVNAGVSVGARLSDNLDLLAGVQGGLLWNLQIKSEMDNGDSGFMQSEQPHTNFNSSLRAGLRYHLLPYFSATASVSKNFYEYDSITPRSSFTEAPAITRANLSSYSAQLGISVDIPWEANPYDDREPTYRRGAPIIEDRRFSLSYELRNYTYSYSPNTNYSSGLNSVKKGFLRARYQQYLTRNFFMSASGGYLVPSQGGSFFSGGPVNFQSFNLDLLMGLRWGKVSLFSGIEGGLLWDMRIKSQNQVSDISWNAPANVQSSFTRAFKAGIEYHILKYVSVKAKLFYNNYQHSQLESDLQAVGTPAINSAELAPFSASVGISFSIPWKSKYNRGAPPPSPGRSAPRRQDPSGEADPGMADIEKRELPPMVTRPPESTPAELTFVNPIPARRIMTSPFGDQREHDGLDINAEMGDEILSVAQGEVIYTGWPGAYGRLVKVRHPAGFLSKYAHLSEIKVEVGQKVEKGDVIGLAGNSGRSTGPHLHFELLRMDLPINPRRYIIYDWQDWNP